MVKILILETDEALRTQTAETMTQLGYSALSADDSDMALEVLEKQKIDMIIADMNCGGCELCSYLRMNSVTVPVIVFTNQASRHEKRVIFRSGADGYMFPPVDMEELGMRVKSLLWRCHVVDDAVIRFGSCVLEAENNLVVTDAGTVELRRMEFLLLQKLLSYPGHIFSRAKLMDEVWGYDSESDPRTVDTHIRRLRQKLKKVDDIRIQTVRGLGYRAVLPTSQKKY